MSRDALEDFIEQVLSLSDEDRLAAAEARKAIDERYHASALRAAADPLARRGEAYVEARRRLIGAHVPDSLGDEAGRSLDPREVAGWNEVARLVQQAIDDAVVALLVSDVLHPKHLRELYRPWQGVLVDGRREESRG